MSHPLTHPSYEPLSSFSDPVRGHSRPAVDWVGTAQRPSPSPPAPPRSRAVGANLKSLRHSQSLASRPSCFGVGLRLNGLTIFNGLFCTGMWLVSLDLRMRGRSIRMRVVSRTGKNRLLSGCQCHRMSSNVRKGTKKMNVSACSSPGRKVLARPDFDRLPSTWECCRSGSWDGLKSASAFIESGNITSTVYGDVESSNLAAASPRCPPPPVSGWR